VPIKLAQGFGMLFLRRVTRWNGHACRTCGTELFRRYQNGTLVKGWWGVISFVSNFFYIAGNLKAKKVLDRMRPPAGPPAPGQRPLPVGRPLVQRAGVWVVAAMIVISGVSFARDLQSDGPPSSTPQVGDCGQRNGTKFVRVPCDSGDAAYRVVAVLPLSADPDTGCPTEATAYSIGSDHYTCWASTSQGA
jgi:hypothetical protein